MHNTNQNRKHTHTHTLSNCSVVIRLHKYFAWSYFVQLDLFSKSLIVKRYTYISKWMWNVAKIPNCYCEMSREWEWDRQYNDNKCKVMTQSFRLLILCILFVFCSLIKFNFIMAVIASVPISINAWTRFMHSRWDGMASICWKFMFLLQ